MDRIKLITWTFVFFFAVNLVSAASISGTVLDDEGNPLANVAVVAEGTEIGTVTGEDGKFILTGLDLGNYELIFTYFSSERRVIAKTGQEVDVSLLPLVQLETITIEAERPILLPILEIYTPRIATSFGNCDPLICSSAPLTIRQNEQISVSGSRSTYDDFSFSQDLKEFYVGVPKDDFDFLLRTRGDSFFFYDYLSDLLQDHESSYPNLAKKNIDEFNIQLSELQPGSYYIILKVINPDVSFDEGFTWHQFNLLPSTTTDEQLEEATRRGSALATYNPRDFSTCSETLAPGTICYNNRQVPAIYSQWSCKESDYLQQELYNNPYNPSICDNQPDVCGCLNSAGTFVTNCPTGYSHVAEYSCENSCQSPARIEACPQEYKCIYALNSAGACKKIPYEDLIERDASIMSLKGPTLYEDTITLQLTDTDLVDMALCGETPDLSGFKVSEIPIPTSSVIKQLTGFFAKLTGKPTAGTQTVFTKTTETTAYSELSNLEHPYAAFHQNQVRFLDRKIGSALLKEYGYTQEILNTALQSPQTSFTYINEQGISSNLRLTNLGLGLKFTLPVDTYGAIFTLSRNRALQHLDSSFKTAAEAHARIMAIHKDPNNYKNLQFISVQTFENKFLEIDNVVYSVSRGLYLIPFPIDERVNYKPVEDPRQNPDLRVYYELRAEMEGLRFSVGTDRSLYLPFLNPSEGYHLLRELPEGLELMEKAFEYRGTPVKYRIIPLKDPQWVPGRDYDYGSFNSRGIFLVPEKNIVILDNEYYTVRGLRQKPGLKYNPPSPAAKFAYNFQFFDIVRQSLADKAWDEYKSSLGGWFRLNVVDPIVKHYINPSPTTRA